MKQLRFRGLFAGRQSGSANLMMVATAAIGLGVASKVVLDNSSNLNQNLKEQVVEREASLDAQKLLTAAGFMVANNLVVCKENGFARGNRCQWHSGSLSKVFKPSDFGLKEPTSAKEFIRFKVDVGNEAFLSGSDSRLDSGSVVFSLVDQNQEKNLSRFIGTKDNRLAVIDKDRSFIKAAVDLEYEIRGKKVVSKSVSYFRRPIPIVTTQVKSDPVCTGRCSATVSANGSPACRGQTTAGPGTKVDILVKTTNNGPGVLYDLAYEREICFNSTPGGGCSPGDAGATQVKVPIKNALDVGESIEWTDQVPCQQFTQVVRNRSRVGGRVEQHVTTAGRVNYELNAESPKSSLEPFRMNQKVDETGDSFPGLLNMIYVDPPH